MTITDKKAYEVSSATSLTGTVVVNAGDWVLATVSTRSLTTFPPGWEVIYDSGVFAGNGNNQRMMFAKILAETTGTLSLIVNQATAGRIYINLISIMGISGLEFIGDSVKTGTSSSLSPSNKSDGEARIWGCSADLWGSGRWETTPNDLDYLGSTSSTQPRQANFIDLGAGAINRTFTTAAATSCICAAVRPQSSEYKSDGAAIYYITGMDAIGMINSGILWNEDVPEDTTLTVSVSLDGEIFEAVENAGPIVENGTDVTELWIKIEMTTEDVYVTPSLSQLRIWLQDEQDKYVLVLHMPPIQRFNSAAGDISVAYDASVGNLAGLGGPVDNFNVLFAPEDLIAKPHQNVREHLEVTNISAVAANIRIYYTHSAEDEHLEVANISAVAALIHIDDI